MIHTYLCLPYSETHTVLVSDTITDTGPLYRDLSDRDRLNVFLANAQTAKHGRHQLVLPSSWGTRSVISSAPSRVGPSFAYVLPVVIRELEYASSPRKESRHECMIFLADQ